MLVVCLNHNHNNNDLEPGVGRKKRVVVYPYFYAVRIHGVVGNGRIRVAGWLAAVAGIAGEIEGD